MTNTNNFSVTTLATFDEALGEVKQNPDNVPAGADADTPDWNKGEMLRELRVMTKTFEDRTKKYFQPRVAAHYLDARSLADGGDVDGLDLLLDHELYELTAVINGDGTTLDSALYTLMPQSGPPYSRIRLKPGGIAWVSNVETGDPVESIRVTGVWLAGRPYSGQWLAAVDTLDAGVGSGDETLTLTWAGDTDPFGRSPRFSPGQLIRASRNGVTEYLGILDTDEALSTLTVRRGERGTDPIALDDGAEIDVWFTDPRVAYAVAYGTAFLYKQRGRFSTSEYNPETGANTKYSVGLPGIVEEIIAEYTTSPTGPRIRAI